MSEVRQVAVHPRGTTLEVTRGERSVTLEVPLAGHSLVSLREEALSLLAEQRADSERASEALARDHGLIEVRSRLGASLWIDRCHRVSGDHLVETIKLCRAAMSDGGRLLVVSGEVSVSASDDYDSVGALAAAVIRLRVDQWLGVGLAVKALSTQVGLEGSWDGESLWWENPTDAYDYTRAWPTAEDIVLVSGLPASEISALLGMIEADHR